MAQSKKAQPKKQSVQAQVRELRAEIKELEADCARYESVVRQQLPKKRIRFTRKEIEEMERERPGSWKFVEALLAELQPRRRGR